MTFFPDLPEGQAWADSLSNCPHQPQDRRVSHLFATVFTRTERCVNRGLTRDVR